MTHAKTITHRVHVLRDELADRRRRRRMDARLRRELACYTSPGDVDDLLAVFASHEGPEAERARAILLGNRASASQERFAG
jgi:hypothetical protein